MARLQENYQAYNWIRADHGESDAEVYRLVGEQTFYLKVGGSDLAAEAERLEWLAAQGMPVPHVVEAGADWLVTTEVAGVPAAELDHVVDAMASVARMLHALPVEACPYRRDLAVTTEQAHKQVSNGLVDLENLEDEYDGWTGEQLLERLRQSRPADEDLVVCHGDFTPENVLLDPLTGAVTGLIDVGRLGVADRWLDLAIAYREFCEEDARRFLSQYGTPLAAEKLAYYVLLDEFF
ncbi:APH(3') family aminoglycoside O-phosphotransferase [Kribbella sp. NPDC056951]|uniref:APH(3') family aminoglycoside O-phosphotransferase n=1 Tax=Kribbella sp. NPDC056951 TaxID=3345978 RepID=UPI00363130AD